MSELKQDEVLNEEIEKTQSCCESSSESTRYTFR